MGIDDSFGKAIVKSHISAGNTLPQEGNVFISLSTHDKTDRAAEIARGYAELGFTILATNGTAAFLREHGIEAVMHFAAFAYVGESVEKPHKYYQNNIVATLSLFEAMRNVINGEGHFIGELQTMQAMERDYVYPKFGDRLEPTAWQMAGASNAWDKANEDAKRILASEEPNYIENDCV